MGRNEGTIDRAVRGFVVAPLALVAAVIGGYGTIATIALVLVAAVMAVTAAVGFCPLYRLVGVSTCPVDARDS